MYVVRFLIAYGVVSAFGILVSLFLAQNTQREQVAFFGQDIATSLAWIMLGAAAFGFLLAALLLVPGRIGATLHIWSLRREAKELDEELVWQDERHDNLLDHHERLVEGHEGLLRAHRRVVDQLEHAIKERDTLRLQLVALTSLDRSVARAGNGDKTPSLTPMPETNPAAPYADHSANASATGMRLSAAPDTGSTWRDGAAPHAAAQVEQDAEDEEMVSTGVRPRMARASESAPVIPGTPALGADLLALGATAEHALQQEPKRVAIPARLEALSAQFTQWLQGATASLTLQARSIWTQSGTYLHEGVRTLTGKLGVRQSRTPAPTHPR